MSYQAPNFTQIPNSLLDDHLQTMTEAELRIVLVIARKTFGWHKRQDKLSLSQLRVLTGMSRQGVLNGLEAGIERGVIRREADGQGYLYELVITEYAPSPKSKQSQSKECTPSVLVNEVDQSATSPPSRPALVHQVDQLDTQTSPRSRHTKESNTKENIKKEVSESDRAIAAPPPTPVTPTLAPPPATPKSETATATATAKPRMGSDDYDHPGVKAKAPSPNSGAPLPEMERTVFVTPKRGRPNADTLSPHVKGAKFTDADLVEPNTGKNPAAVFYEFYSIYDNRLSAPVEDRLVKRNLNLAQWRSAVEAWQDADHRPTYIKGILDWYNDPSKYARKEVTNGTSHSRGGAQRPNQPVEASYTTPAIKFYHDPDDPF